jgi:hypothetical protein
VPLVLGAFATAVPAREATLDERAVLSSNANEGGRGASVWRPLVMLGTMAVNESESRVRRQAGVVLSAMAQAIGGEMVGWAVATLNDAVGREKSRVVRETFERAIVILRAAKADAATIDREGVSSSSASGDLLRSLVKVSARE